MSQLVFSMHQIPKVLVFNISKRRNVPAKARASSECENASFFNVLLEASIRTCGPS